MARLAVCTLPSLFFALVACTTESVVTTGGSVSSGGGTGELGKGGATGAGARASGRGIGEICAATIDCRNGLVCTGDRCDFGHGTAEGSPCVASGECKDGVKCAPGIDATGGRPTRANVCTAANGDAGLEGAACTSDLGCQSALRCGIVGFGAECVPEGTADVGQPCVVSADCYGGLICAPGTASTVLDAGAGPGSCAPISASPADIAAGRSSSFGVPVAPALACEKPTDGAVTAYFDIPHAPDSAPSGDFFRLPFPNDARITNGKIDLTGFPTPGAFLLGFDPVQIYLDAITANESAWGTSPSVLFRFSGHLDRSSINFVSGQESPVQFLDITDPKNPGNGGASWVYSPSGGKYICQDWLGVRSGVLVPGHTYTVMLTAALTDSNGKPVLRAPAFTAMLSASAPTEPTLLNGYRAFKPLRDYLSIAGSADTVIDATVFTVASTRKPMDALAAAALAAPAPVASDWVKCGGGAVSPCPQADDTRACGSGTGDYDEYHALIAVPIFQKGTAPYLDAGGDIAESPVRTEKICASLTVPKKTMPTAGFPLAVFAHGTGGSFRDHVREEVAGALARATPAMAVIGYDQVEHGPRRGASTASPNDLFFNFKNPAAARGNPMQGGVDVISMGRLAATLTVPASVTAGTAIKIDPTAAVFFGHSQGSMHGSLGLPYTSAYTAAVLSGNGASLMHALLTKTSPDNIAAAVPFALGGDYDGNFKLAGGELHPVLTILQQWIDPADPLNFANTIGREPNPGILPKSIFQTYGLGDTFSPPQTLQLYAEAANLALAVHDGSVTTPDTFGSLQEQPVPLAGNVVIQATPPATTDHTVTLAVREYQNAAGKDGHFVVFDVPSANQDAVRFLSTAAAGKVPPVGNK